MATMLEAEPFVRGLGLAQLAPKPFAVFGRDNLRLLISGIGKADAAMGCAHLIVCHQPAVVCNPGAAGATDYTHALGECRHIARIIEPDRPDLNSGAPCAHRPDILPGFPLAVLATHDRPIRDRQERAALSSWSGLVDMEAAAIAQVCARYGVPCYCFKYVSDLPDHNALQDIRTNITRLREPFFDYFAKEVLPVIEQKAREAGLTSPGRTLYLPPDDTNT